MHALRLLVTKQLTAAWRYRWFAVLFTWLICAVGWAYVLSIPNQYLASARLFVDSEAVLTPLLRGLAADNGQGRQLDFLQRTLLSRPNLEKLVSKTDLVLEVNGPADLQKAVEKLSRNVWVNSQGGGMFWIGYRDPNPKLAYDIVQTVLTSFVESKAGNNRAEIANAQAFLQQQINAYERQLRDAERKRAEFRAKYIDLLPSGDGGASKLESASYTVRRLQGQLEDAIGRREALTKEVANTPPLVVTESDGVGGPAGDGRVRAAEIQLQELLLRFTDQHPDVVALRTYIRALKAGTLGSTQDPAAAAAARAAPAGRSRSVPNPVYEQLKVRLVETDSTVASLQRQLAEEIKERDRLDTIARGAPTLQAEYTNLNRDYDVLRQNFEGLLARRESMRISEAAELDSDKLKLQIIEPTQVPTTPVGPARLLMLSGVLAAALAGGGALALLLVQFDQSFHSLDELRDLGFTVVGGVSLLAASVPLRRRVASLGAFALAVLLPIVVYGGLAARVLGLKLPA